MYHVELAEPLGVILLFDAVVTGIRYAYVG